MGYALAEAAAALGADVTLVSGPTHLDAPGGVGFLGVVSAKEMFDAATEAFRDADIAVMSAAVADYRPKTPVASKIKKSDAVMTIELEPTDDILKTLGQTKRSDQITVGFALETDNEVENAKAKLVSKNCDMIVLNSMRDEGAGFGHDTNRVTLITRNKIREMQLKSKAEVAEDIWTAILKDLLNITI